MNAIQIAEELLIEAHGEIFRLKSERNELRSCLEQCLRRLDKLNEGGPEEPDPTTVMVREVLKRTEPK